MNLLRAESEIAVNDLFVAASNAHSIRREAAGLLQGTEEGTALEAAAERLAEILAGLAAWIEDRGDIPSSPPEEIQLLRELVDEIEASPEGVRTLVADRLRASEEMLAEAARRALAAGLDDHARGLAGRAGDDAAHIRHLCDTLDPTVT